jgi:hypothetical protein
MAGSSRQRRPAISGDYYNRAIIARNGLTANTPKEAIYIGGVTGSDGNRLSGKHRYKVTFKALPFYVEPGFWSLTLYDLANNYTVPNPINRYSLGSGDKTLKLNPDGSLTIYLQKGSPGAAHEANWLPAPEGGYYLILRAYAPGEALIRSQTDPDAFPCRRLSSWSKLRLSYQKFSREACLSGRRPKTLQGIGQHVPAGL